MNILFSKLFLWLKKQLGVILFSVFCILILVLALRGYAGNPTVQALTTMHWQDNGPFELSPERGRFALLYSIVEDHSLQFSDAIGMFARPDVAVSKGKYVSLFAPLLSFIIIPGYVIGKFFGASQVGTFAVVALFALFNFLLIRNIAIRLGANRIAATLGAFVFLFATPGFAYAVNLYQHQFSTFLILLSVWALLKSDKVWSLVLVFFLCAMALPLDYPNLFLMFPVGFYALGRIVSLEKIKDKLSVKISLLNIFTPLIMVIPVLFFLWFNQASYGNPLQLSGTLPAAQNLPVQKKSITNTVLQAQSAILNPVPNTSVNKTVIKFFKTRNLLNGFYIHFVSPDRSVIYFTPVILLGIFGAFLAYKKKIKMVALFISIIGADILLYSMWGDPWGGWGFGSRYLIPGYAILSIFIALLLSYCRKNVWLLLLFVTLFSYSAAVNTLGAITTSAMPPQVEVLALEKASGIIQRYTYQRNWEFLLSGNSKAFVFQTFAKKYLSAEEYYEILVSLIILAGLSITTLLWFQKGIGNE